MKKIIIILFLALVSQSSFSLEVDEKLTLRVINTSASKKTILINRGEEDGLQEGDHAKFFLTVGVVARGVVVKVSPTRSVWSLYRLVNVDYIVEEQVMNLKITPAVKITKDESRMIVADDLPRAARLGSQDPRDLGIPLAPGADDYTEDDHLREARQARSELNFDNFPKSLVDKNKEVFGSISYSSLPSSTLSDGGREYKVKEESVSLSIGAEYYFEYFKNISLGGSLAYRKYNSMSYSGESVANNSTDFLGFVNIHFLRKHSDVHTFIPFVNIGGGFGSIESIYTPGGENSFKTDSVSTNGSSLVMSFGIGAKYFTPSGFGGRLILDYYSRKDTFEEDVNKDLWSKVSSGPRIYLGVGQRF